MCWGGRRIWFVMSGQKVGRLLFRGNTGLLINDHMLTSGVNLCVTHMYAYTHTHTHTHTH